MQKNRFSYDLKNPRAKGMSSTHRALTKLIGAAKHYLNFLFVTVMLTNRNSGRRFGQVGTKLHKLFTIVTKALDQTLSRYGNKDEKAKFEDLRDQEEHNGKLKSGEMATVLILDVISLKSHDYFVTTKVYRISTNKLQGFYSRGFVLH